MGPIGGEVAEIRHIDQLVVRYRRALDAAVDDNDAVLGRAVAFSQVDVQEVLHPGPQVG